MDKLHSPFLASTQEAHTGLGVLEWTGHPILARPLLPRGWLLPSVAGGEPLTPLLQDNLKRN